MAIVEFKNYSFDVPTKGRITVNGSLEQATLCVLSGPSGIGKTTFLKTLAGLCPESEKGSFCINNQEFCASHLARPLSMVFQGPQLFSHLSVFENLLISFEPSPTLKHLSTEIKKERVVEFLKPLGLLDKLYQPASDLSGGEEQRVAVCRALLTQAPFVIFDEPLSALDDAMAKILLDILKKEVVTRKSTFLMVNHRALDLPENAKAISWRESDTCLNF